MSISRKKTIPDTKRRPLFGAILLLTLLLQATCLYGLSGRVNINTAGKEELERLPYIGESRARAIIEQREAGDGFRTVEQLLDNAEIGPSTYEAIQPYLTLSGETTLGTGTGEEVTARPLSWRSKAHFNTRAGDVRLLVDSDYFAMLTEYVHFADKRIDMAFFIIRTTDSPKNRAGLLVKELGDAARRGVEVHVLLERSEREKSVTKANQKSAALLQQQGIKVAFDDSGRTMHAKVVVIDNRHVFIGSHNLTHSALVSNSETSLLIDSPDLAGELLAYIEDTAVPVEAKE
jgi:competence ComEA-like helix-hairpin-helix protein